MDYLILTIVAVVSFAVGRKTASSHVKTSARQGKTFAPRSAEELGDMRTEAREALDERTEERKKKILDLMGGVAVHQEELRACNITDIKKGITTENVEKLLAVSGATARKYLNELEDENKIKQIGKTGRDVYYTLLHQN